MYSLEKRAKRVQRAPSVAEYALMREEDKLLAWELFKARKEKRTNELKLARMQGLMSAALIHKIRAQRRDPYTPEECAARLAAATAERFPKK